jgi:hypothetical protein
VHRCLIDWRAKDQTLSKLQSSSDLVCAFPSESLSLQALAKPSKSHNVYKRPDIRASAPRALPAPIMVAQEPLAGQGKNHLLPLNHCKVRLQNPQYITAFFLSLYNSSCPNIFMSM